MAKFVKKKRIIIVRPFGKLGGQLVLATICKLLRENGYDAKLFHIPCDPHIGSGNKARDGLYLVRFWYYWLRFCLKRIILTTKLQITKDIQSEYYYLYYELLKGTKEKRTPFFNKRNTIVVYPETIWGDFLGAKDIIRYIMYYPNYPNDNTYGKNDLFVFYRKIFNNYFLYPNVVEIPFCSFDKGLYRQYNYGERHGNCYFVRKGSQRDDLPTTFDGPVLDNLTEIEKVKYLNACKTCYVYDTQTFYASIASVCGCETIVMLEKGKNPSDYISENENHYGVAYGNTPDQLNYAQQTRSKLLESLDFTEKNRENINKFIENIVERFGEIKRI